ncbi:MAG: tetratricopeptide repeat protein [Thermaerobacter sp.]|nr:tetratricopeptide repeat protein [Thermaerobacter sp.]
MRHLAQSNEAEALYTKAERHETVGELDEAEDLYRQFSDLLPDDPRGPNKLGVCQALRGQLDNAERFFQQALALNPQYPPALTNLGNILLERHNLEGAVAKYEEALLHDPDYSPAHNNLAAALKRMGQFQPAVQHLRQAHRSWRRQDRQRMRREAQGCTARGTTVLVLASVGVLSLGVFWR